MKMHVRTTLAAHLLIAATLTTVHAATVSQDTPLHLKPEPASPVVATLSAGTSFTALTRDELSTEGIATLPAGWVATRYPGPVYGYAPIADVGKDLFLKPGAIVRADPEQSATFVSMIGTDDRAQVMEVVGDWSKVALARSMILFLNTGATANTSIPLFNTQTPAAVESQAQAAPEPAAAPSSPPSPPPTPNAGAIDATPRVFQGYFMKTRRILGIGPKLDYQLVDENGRRIALLDLGALLITDPLDEFENREISVFGPVSRPAGVKDMVIRVETLRLTKK